ncbi:MAG: NUDIX domain-containing protein [Bacilli bacterium]|nr:NUDIX domain-containing protein [Bacilli bacterium]
MKEYFDVLDCNRKSLDYKKERGEKLLDHEYNMGAEDFIICDNKILMTQRSPEKSHPGMWEVPGGCSQAGEESFDTLVREMSEEVGVKVDSSNTRYIGTKLYKKQFVDIYETVTSIDIHDIKVQEEEVSEVRFVGKEEFEELVSQEKVVPSVLNRFHSFKDLLSLDW